MFNWNCAERGLNVRRHVTRSPPGVKGDPVEEGTIVVVPDVIPNHSLAGAWLRHQLVLDGDIVFGVMNVHQEDVKHQGRLRGDLWTWWVDSPKLSATEKCVFMLTIWICYKGHKYRPHLNFLLIFLISLMKNDVLYRMQPWNYLIIMTLCLKGVIRYM